MMLSLITNQFSLIIIFQKTRNGKWFLSSVSELLANVAFELLLFIAETSRTNELKAIKWTKQNETKQLRRTYFIFLVLIENPEPNHEHRLRSECGNKWASNERIRDPKVNYFFSNFPWQKDLAKSLWSEK